MCGVKALMSEVDQRFDLLFGGYGADDEQPPLPPGEEPAPPPPPNEQPKSPPPAETPHPTAVPEEPPYVPVH